MTLKELSLEYRIQSERLQERIRLLKRKEQTCTDSERSALQDRIHILETLWREARDLAVLTDRYYERGYRRNERYTL